MNFKLPKTQNITLSNYDQFFPVIMAGWEGASVCGIDLETHDENAHEGIKQYRGKDTADAFDWRRMEIVGVSLYQQNSDTAYYFNIGHADVEERITWEMMEKILDGKPESCAWVAHNAAFEITVTKNNRDYDLDQIICTNQMAVSAYGPDEYSKMAFVKNNLKGINGVFAEVIPVFAEFNPKAGRYSMNAQQQALFNKVFNKQSYGGNSYQGMIQDICYGYGLKKAVKSHFNYDMTTYEQALNGKPHMGACTSEEIAAYGADDSFWAVQLYFFLFQYMTKHCPKAINAFFTQENPMVQVYATLRREGLRVNSNAIKNRTDMERHEFAETLRKFKLAVRDLLPFPVEQNEKLAKYDAWYKKDFEKYRERLAAWAETPNDDDDLKQVCQISSAVGSAWSGKKIEALNLTHYYQSRLFMYDLTPVEPIIYKGKVQSDAETRGEVREKLRKLYEDNPGQKDYLDKCDLMLKLMGDMAQIEQRMKLYLTPYQLLTDPETGRMYPEVSSMLATRRMAGSNPNTMQLAKRGTSTYVRGFFLPDSEDEVLVSLDWSQVELVLVGEFSNDKEFAKAYGQTPYQDLHLGATADLLSVGREEEITEDFLKNLHKMDAKDVPEWILRKPNGDTMTPKEAKKFWRTELGKKANFGYWYSGALSDVGESMLWTSDQMWAATEIYRNRFPEAEKWRLGCINEARDSGEIELPDGHKRVRYECTYEWMREMERAGKEWNSPGVDAFIQVLIKAVSSRAGNQIVNAAIQGSSATLAKRSILAINKKLKELGIRGRFKMPIHDELVFSIHKDDVIKFLHMAKLEMTNHPEIVKKLKLLCTASIGLTFEPFDKVKVPLGQIELDEAPEILGFEDGSVLNDEQIGMVINYLFEKKKELEAA